MSEAIVVPALVVALSVVSSVIIVGAAVVDEIGRSQWQM